MWHYDHFLDESLSQCPEASSLSRLGKVASLPQVISIINMRPSQADDVKVLSQMDLVDSLVLIVAVVTVTKTAQGAIRSKCGETLAGSLSA
jgi:hypothetical protein